MSEIIDRRQSDRWLCNQNFSTCAVVIGQLRYELHAINFNRHGIGLFCSDRLPPGDHCLISFHYSGETREIRADDIPAAIKYSQETEVGSNYGLRFELETCSARLKSDLITIEKNLTTSQAYDDRYGLF